MTAKRTAQDDVNDAWSAMRQELDRTAVISAEFKHRLMVLANDIGLACKAAGREEGAKQLALDFKTTKHRKRRQ
jgi:hypothetical protein